MTRGGERERWKPPWAERQEEAEQTAVLGGGVRRLGCGGADGVISEGGLAGGDTCSQGDAAILGSRIRNRSKVIVREVVRYTRGRSGANEVTMGRYSGMVRKGAGFG